MIGHLEVGHGGLAEALYLHVLAVVLADGHGGVDDVGDDQHPLPDLPSHLLLLALHLLQFPGDGLDPLLHFLGLVLLPLAHELADLFADLVALLPQLVPPGLGGPELLVQGQDFVHQGQLLVLELLLDVLLHQLRVGADQFHIQHTIYYPPCPLGRFFPLFQVQVVEQVLQVFLPVELNLQHALLLAARDLHLPV